MDNNNSRITAEFPSNSGEIDRSIIRIIDRQAMEIRQFNAENWERTVRCPAFNGTPRAEIRQAIRKLLKENQTYTLQWNHQGVDHSITRTLAELTEYYGYTLECGHSWKHSIPLKPKTINALVKAINDSIDQTNGGYDRPYVHLIENPKEVQS